MVQHRYALGVRGTALNFDGQDDYVFVPRSPALQNLQQMTIAYWIKYYKPTSGPNNVSTTVTNGPDKSSEDGFFTYAESDRIKHYLGRWGDATNAIAEVSLDARVPVSQQTFVFVTFVVADNRVFSYKNSLKEQESARNGKPISRSSQDWYIAQSGYPNYPYFLNGQLDEIRIYNRALSESEVRELYQQMKPCEVPFFWQRNPNNWNSHPLRSNGQCSADYDTIGKGGCTLTSAAMVFRHYGADQTLHGVEMNPANLSDCMGTSACYFNWLTGATCSGAKAFNPRTHIPFSWTRLDQRLNQNHHPVILGLCTKATCKYEDDTDPNTHAMTHWIVVSGGQGSAPTDYSIWDPWYECGQNMRLNSRSETWEPRWIAVYEGKPTCGFSIEVPQCARSVAPVGIPVGTSTIVAAPMNTDLSKVDTSLVISGTPWVYRATDITMTVHLAAQSSISNVTEMLVWSDTVSNTTWQSYTPFVWLPLSNLVYVRFRDSVGNVSDVYADTTNPSSPLTEPDPRRIYLPLTIRNG